jgi:hypothetical protein
MDVVDMMYNLIDNAKKKGKGGNVKEVKAPQAT